MHDKTHDFQLKTHLKGLFGRFSLATIKDVRPSEIRFHFVPLVAPAYVSGRVTFVQLPIKKTDVHLSVWLLDLSVILIRNSGFALESGNLC